MALAASERSPWQSDQSLAITDKACQPFCNWAQYPAEVCLSKRTTRSCLPPQRAATLKGQAASESTGHKSMPVPDLPLMGAKHMDAVELR